MGGVASAFDSDVRLGRVSPVAVRPDEGPVSQPTAGVQLLAAGTGLHPRSGHLSCGLPSLEAEALVKLIGGLTRPTRAAGDRQRLPLIANRGRRRSWAMPAWPSGKRSNRCYGAGWRL